jgi:hypothetical protein
VALISAYSAQIMPTTPAIVKLPNYGRTKVLPKVKILLGLWLTQNLAPSASGPLKKIRVAIT